MHTDGARAYTNLAWEPVQKGGPGSAEEQGVNARPGRVVVRSPARTRAHRATPPP